jgi:hypothetical protein
MERKSYQTMEAAQIDADAFVFDKFCPLTKTTCNPNCVCFRRAWVQMGSDKEDLYYVQSSGCDNAMFNGETYPQI